MRQNTDQKNLRIWTLFAQCLAQSFTRAVRQLDYIIMDFWFTLLSFLCAVIEGNKQMKIDWTESSHESFYYTCPLRINFYGGLFHILQLIKLVTISSKEEQLIIFFYCSSRRSCVYYGYFISESFVGWKWQNFWQVTKIMIKPTIM